MTNREIKQTPFLKIEGLKKIFKDGKNNNTALAGVDFTVEEGESLAIVGESGSGKSTIARCITGFINTTEGSVLLKGEEISNRKARDMKKVYEEVQMVFQNPMSSFDPRKTLGKSISEPLKNRGIDRRNCEKKVEELLTECGLPAEYRWKYPHEVSGGECQRAAIARALSADPKLLICDEATSALDVTVQKQVLELLDRLKAERNMTLLLITHDLAVAKRLCDKILVMKNGSVIEYGDAKEILSNPQTEYTKKLIASVL